jgi:hypothetical protein
MTTTVNAVNITDMLTVLFLGHRTGVPKIAVVITDGNSANRAQTFAEAKKARASGIQVLYRAHIYLHKSLKIVMLVEYSIHRNFRHCRHTGSLVS